MLQAGVKVSKFEFRNLKDKLANSRSPEYQANELPGMLIHRKVILETLLAFLPPESLHLDAEFESITQTEDLVTAHFKDGT
ncbi:MAG TPA: hypothetical protein V6C71_06855 [Coleofasciculaceae cyanobacterium]|jgi:2-polyprenyl-6-methoxyphenol hydroxylase-like FAD-dependent oxidoreductase